MGERLPLACVPLSMQRDIDSPAAPACVARSDCKPLTSLPSPRRAAYGDDAFSIVPRTYTLPGQVREWREWMAAWRAGGGTGPGRLWMLKTAQHLGKGLKLMPHHKAAKEMLLQHQRAETARRQGPAHAKQVRPFVVAQQYVENPLLIDGRKFGIRVWALVTSTQPLRVYLHERGLVLFSTDGYDAATLAGADGAVAGGHVTNYAQNRDGGVWDLSRLRTHLGDAAYARLHAALLTSVARVYAAALGPMQRESARLGSPRGGAFEVMGLDYLIDADLHPWLLEVNSTPSLAVEHSDPLVERLIYEQKNTMVEDTFRLLQLPGRFLQPAGVQEGKGLPPLRRPAPRAARAEGSGDDASGERVERSSAAAGASTSGEGSTGAAGGAADQQDPWAKERAQRRAALLAATKVVAEMRRSGADINGQVRCNGLSDLEALVAADDRLERGRCKVIGWGPALARLA